MPTNSNSDHPPLFERVFRGAILLALPWVSLQQQMLEVLRLGITDAANVKPIQNFTLQELQALMMILDRSGRLRNIVGTDFEGRMQSLVGELFPKLTSASIHTIEAQERILKDLFEALDRLRKADIAKHSSDGQAAGHSD